MAHFALPSGDDRAMENFNQLLTKLGLHEIKANADPEDRVVYLHYKMNPGQIEALEAAGFMRLDVHKYQILPPPQTDREKIMLIKALGEHPSTMDPKPEGYAGMHITFTHLVSQEARDRAHQQGFTVTYMPPRARNA